MKYDVHGKRLNGGCGRSPCGERGLKFRYIPMGIQQILVAPRAGSVG